MFFVFGLLLQAIFLSPALLVWALLRHLGPQSIALNSYLMTFICLIVSMVVCFVFKVELEGGLITGVIIFSVLSFLLSLALVPAILVIGYVKLRKNALKNTAV